MASGKTKILIVFANPVDTPMLRLGAEDRTIREALARGEHRDSIRIDMFHAATVHDLRRALLRRSYRVLQFSGHGHRTGLLFEDVHGSSQELNFEALASFLGAHSPPLECVILNACSTLQEGQLLSYHVPYVIAMKAPIQDRLAAEFSRGFYDAIAAGKGFKFAYKEGCRCARLVTKSREDLPVLIRRSMREKYFRQPRGVRAPEYDRWHRQLSAGELETRLDPGATNELHILLSILDKVLQSNGFDRTTIDRASIILWELVSNVARHAGSSPAELRIELNTRYLPMVVISVADHGAGYNLNDMREEQAIWMKSGEPEHGVGRILRLSDDWQQTQPSASDPYHTVFCSVYQIPPLVSALDQFPWCARVVISYQSPYPVWFGESRYSLYGILYTLDFALRNDIRPLLDVYLESLLTSDPRYLCLESRGHQFPTEVSDLLSLPTIIAVLETSFQQLFEQKAVLCLANGGSNAGTLKELSLKYGLEFFTSEDACRQRMKDIDHA